MKKHNSNTEKHEILPGGRVTQNVIRIGETVRRPLSKNARFVHSLLKHLEKVEFKGAPRFLGIDESNREMLSFIEGYVPPDLDEWSDEQLVAAAKLIREYHDATVSFELTDQAEVVCHHDLSPCNSVFQQGLPIAFIDFDAAAPGTRLDDLAYAVWMWCTLGEEEISSTEQARRIKLLLDAYELEQRQNFISEVIKIQARQLEKFKAKVKEGLIHWNESIEWAEACMKWVKEHRVELEQGL